MAHRRSLESELIEEAIRHIQQRGLENFSSRAVAEACHVSCAAPFKYFKGRQDFFQAIAGRLDMELLTAMEEAHKNCGGNHKSAHLAMNRLYIEFLFKYPFLMDMSFWHTVDKTQSAIREWASFQLMIDQFCLYCDECGIPESVKNRYYFEFQTLAYGSAFVMNSGLMLKDETPWSRIEELALRIYKNIEEASNTEN